MLGRIMEEICLLAPPVAVFSIGLFLIFYEDSHAGEGEFTFWFALIGLLFLTNAAWRVSKETRSPPDRQP